MSSNKQGTALHVNYSVLADEVRQAARASSTEEDLRIRIEALLKNRVLDPLKLDWGRYELSAKGVSTLVSGVRIDALHAHVVIEYEHPRTLGRRAVYDHAIQQAKNGIIAHAHETEARYRKYLGVVTDGDQIGFVRFNPKKKAFESSADPLEVDSANVCRLVESIHGLSRKSLDAAQLLRDFGPGSEVSRDLVGALTEKLGGLTKRRTDALFRDWRRVFSQVCAYDPKKLRDLPGEYVPRGSSDPERVLFAVHTYFALVMKLIVAELVSLTWEGTGSFLVRLEDARLHGTQELKSELGDLENGGLFSKLGISNFIQGDYFSWYLSEWDDELADAVARLTKALYSYDPTTASDEPEATRDLFKQLYQNLVPKAIRHDLGEFYTPDWLAELLLEQVGIGSGEEVPNPGVSSREQGSLQHRILDPACGSGTFLVLSIARLRKFADDRALDPRETLHSIVGGVVGFDLNPLAVLASRANYLIALGELLRSRGAEQIEVPVYFADSILTERRVSLEGRQLYILKTEVGEFSLPAEVVKEGSLGKVLTILEECLEHRYLAAETGARVRREAGVGESAAKVIVRLYSQLKALEKKDEDGIWLRILRNSFAPLLLDRFDYVVGNPPWVHWINLPQRYREATAPVWSHYHLASARAEKGGVAIGKKAGDFASLFTVVATDRYLKPGGALAFLVPQSLFKSTAAEGFRSWLRNASVVSAHDLVALNPFEGAQNRTAMIVLRKGGSTTWPIPYTVWQAVNEPPRFTEGLDEVLHRLTRTRLVAKPVGDEASPWLSGTPAALAAIRKLLGTSGYEAHKGVVYSVIGAFWVEVKQTDGPFSRVGNLISGRSKIRVDRHEEWIESSILAPLLRPEDVRDWKATPPTLKTILPYDRSSGRAIDARRMRVNFPKTYLWFQNFQRQIRTVKAQPYGPAFKNGSQPAWWLFNVTKDFFSPFKVVWKYISQDFTAAPVFPLNGEPIIPYEKLMFVSCSSRNEALYLSAVLNSTSIRGFVRAYAIETQLSTHILQRLRVPTWNPRSAEHQALAKASEALCDGSPTGSEFARQVESVEHSVRSLFGLTEEEYQTLKEASLATPANEVESDDAG